MFILIYSYRATFIQVLLKVLKCWYSVLAIINVQTRTDKLNMHSVVVTNVITCYKPPEKKMPVHVTNVILQCSVSCGGIIKHAIIFSFIF